MRLECKFNNLTGESVKHLSGLIVANGSIRFCSLDGNTLGGDGESSVFEELSESLSKCTNLVHLSLSNCNLTIKSSRFLLESVKQCPSLIMLDLSENNLPFKEIQEIQENLKITRKEHQRQRLFEFEERSKLIQEKEHLTVEGIEKILKLRKEMNNGGDNRRKYSEKQLLRILRDYMPNAQTHRKKNKAKKAKI